MATATSSLGYLQPCLYHLLAAIMGDEMGSAKQRPANVPEENIYSRMHWMVIVTYVAAIGAIAMLMIGAG